ncbi:hypothetical protein C1646_756983 [Rhizophagus diaphanus]|nr:hypothetical protein C1646_756983 [Rhizophagus diaphanus] [Rhizophagus sp. MUCL 43196]
MDPKTNEFMLVLQYAKGENLHEYLQTNFVNITWKEKIEIFYQISMGHVACSGCKADEDGEQFDTTNKEPIKILQIDLKLKD